eukprot:gnl/Spiro4/10171_TR5405_c0_g1_i1.p3 gnl/Spiro4/10171_TR5405_c0_g1~~gnl/Spiro4/10171_TR5405_c0_g1_i1.p3  ORF type:complete len:132 (-),score=40.63 gnl/Spiro4/10171_TR5405_c0_g1_i1:53-448(-)
MRAQEVQHLHKMEDLVYTHRVRPSLLTPVWHVAGLVLGAGTALLGKEAAMACTVAVEEVISDHYNNQLRELLAAGEAATDVGETIKKFRDDEIAHRDLAQKMDADKAPMHSVLTATIKTGCCAAIWVAERI